MTTRVVCRCLQFSHCGRVMVGALSKAQLVLGWGVAVGPASPRSTKWSIDQPCPRPSAELPCGSPLSQNARKRRCLAALPSLPPHPAGLQGIYASQVSLDDSHEPTSSSSHHDDRPHYQLPFMSLAQEAARRTPFIKTAAGNIMDLPRDCPPFEECAKLAQLSLPHARAMMDSATLATPQAGVPQGSFYASGVRQVELGSDACFIGHRAYESCKLLTLVDISGTEIHTLVLILVHHILTYTTRLSTTASYTFSPHTSFLTFHLTTPSPM